MPTKREKYRIEVVNRAEQRDRDTNVTQETLYQSEFAEKKRFHNLAHIVTDDDDNDVVFLNDRVVSKLP